MLGTGVFYCLMCLYDSCIKCKNGGSELCCNKCGCYYHVECLSIIPSILETEWCPECMNENMIENIISYRINNRNNKRSIYYHKLKKQLINVCIYIYNYINICNE